MIREAQLLRSLINELQQQLKKAERRLGELDIERFYRDFTTHFITSQNQVITKIR